MKFPDSSLLQIRNSIDLGFQVLSKAVYLSTYYNLLYRLVMIHIADALIPQRLHFDLAWSCYVFFPTYCLYISILVWMFHNFPTYCLYLIYRYIHIPITSPLYIPPHYIPINIHEVTIQNPMKWAGWRFTLRQPMRTCSRRVAMCPAPPWLGNLGYPKKRGHGSEKMMI